MRTKPRPEPSRALARLAPVVLWTIVAGGFGIALLSALAIQRDARWLDVLPFLVLSLVAALPTVQLLETQRERFSFSFQIVPIMAAIAVVPYAAP